MPPEKTIERLTIDAGVMKQQAPDKMRLDPGTGDLVFWALAVDKSEKPNRHGFIFDWDSEADVDVSAMRENPVFLFFHDSDQLPIGQIEDIRIDDSRVMMQVRIPGIESVPENIRQEPLYQTREVIKYEILSGRLRGVSIGFYIGQAEEDRDGNLRIKQIEIVELSVCTIGAHQTALIQQKLSGRINQDAPADDAPPAPKTLQEHTWVAIPYDRHGDEETVDKEAEWSGPDQIANADAEALAMMSLFEDTENPEDKGAYKGPHHVADGNAVVWRGVAAAMAALLGARGGFEGIPDAEHRQGYDHLVKHYEQFDEDPPEYSRQALPKDRLDELHDSGRIMIPGRPVPLSDEQKLHNAADLIKQVFAEHKIEVRIIIPQQDEESAPQPETPGGQDEEVAAGSDVWDDMAARVAESLLQSEQMQQLRQGIVKKAVTMAKNRRK